MHRIDSMREVKPLVRLFSSWPGLSCVVLAIFAIYLSNGRPIASLDNLALQYLPLSIIREGNFDLDEFSFLYANHVLFYPIIYQNGHFLSFAPIGPALLAVPFYLLPALAGISAESPWLPSIEKAAGAGIAALSALFILMTLLRLASPRRALLTTVLYAFGTVTFGVSSQALWPVGSAQLLLALGLYLLVRGDTDPHWTPYAALPLTWAVLCRPSTALIGLILTIYVVQYRRRQFWLFALLTLPAIAFQLTYNAVYLGDFLLPPGYVSTGTHLLARPDNFNTPMLKGLAGLLVSPAVGFFVYSPIFLFAFVGFYRRWRARDPLALYLMGAALAIVLLESKLNMWWGGSFLGPRYVVEIAPILAYFLAFGIPAVTTLWKKLSVGFLLAWSVYANSLVAYAFDGSWDHQAELWSWSNSPIVYYSQKSIRKGRDSVSSLESAVMAWIYGFPDSRSRVGLEAEIHVADLPAHIFTHSFFDLAVRVKNAGPGVWLRQTPDETGMVRFGWRWLRSDGNAQERAAGRAPRLATDLLPGHQTEFAVRIWAPPEPGLYELELGMVSERVAWFGPDGGAPMRVSIEVAGESRCLLDRALTLMVDPTEPPLQLEWITARTAVGSNEVLSTLLNIFNPGPPRVLYPVIVLQWPSGAYTFFDFQRQTFQDLCPTWSEVQWPLFIDHGYRAVEYPILSFLLTKMPEGPYSLYFLYLRPKQSAIYVVGKAALTFARFP